MSHAVPRVIRVSAPPVRVRVMEEHDPAQAAVARYHAAADRFAVDAREAWHSDRKETAKYLIRQSRMLRAAARSELVDRKPAGLP